MSKEGPPGGDEPGMIRGPGASQSRSFADEPLNDPFENFDSYSLINAGIVANISKILGGSVVDRSLTDLGRQRHWVIQTDKIKLVLVAYRSSAPYTVLGDAEVAVSSKDDDGLFLPVAEFRGISAVEIEPRERSSPAPSLVRFIQEDDQHYAQLIVCEDGSTSARSYVKLAPRYRESIENNTASPG